MKLIVGLGNPGQKYAGTRHNIGFQVAAKLAHRWSIRMTSRLCRSKVMSGVWLGHPVQLVQPQTFMNASGEAVRGLMGRFRVEPCSVLVICDDVALPLGMIRLRGQGSDGGHLGLSSVLEKTRTQAIARLRIGVRTEAVGEDLTAFVLGRFSGSEKKRLEQSIQDSLEACEIWVAQGVSAAMNRFNRRLACRM